MAGTARPLTEGAEGGMAGGAGFSTTICGGAGKGIGGGGNDSARAVEAAAGAVGAVAAAAGEDGSAVCGGLTDVAETLGSEVAISPDGGTGSAWAVAAVEASGSTAAG